VFIQKNNVNKYKLNLFRTVYKVNEEPNPDPYYSLKEFGWLILEAKFNQRWLLHH
jgi:hypothetical protein